MIILYRYKFIKIKVEKGTEVFKVDSYIDSNKINRAWHVSSDPSNWEKDTFINEIMKLYICK